MLAFIRLERQKKICGSTKNYLSLEKKMFLLDKKMLLHDKKEAQQKNVSLKKKNSLENFFCGSTKNFLLPDKKAFFHFLRLHFQNKGFIRTLSKVRRSKAF